MCQEKLFLKAFPISDAPSIDTVTVRVSNLPIYNGEPLATVDGLSGKHLEPDCSSQERYFTPLTVSVLPLGATGAV